FRAVSPWHSSSVRQLNREALGSCAKPRNKWKINLGRASRKLAPIFLKSDKQKRVMNWFINKLAKLGIFKEELDYHFARASMVTIFLFFGYQKWFQYEAQALIPYISNGPLISWMYPVFGVRGACLFLGVAEWAFGLLLFLGFWNKKLGILGAIGSCFSFIA